MIKSKDKKTNPLDQVTKRIEKYIETYDNPLVHDPLTNSFKDEFGVESRNGSKDRKSVSSSSQLGDPLTSGENTTSKESCDPLRMVGDEQEADDRGGRGGNLNRMHFDEEVEEDFPIPDPNMLLPEPNLDPIAEW